MIVSKMQTSSSSKGGGGKYTGSAPSKGNICFVPHCRSKWLQKLSPSIRLSFFKLPRADEEIQNKWRENLSIKRENVTWMKICELHFEPDCFERDLEAELTGRPLRKRLKPGSIPTIYLTKEDNTVADLKGDTTEDIKNCQSLIALANSLRQFKVKPGDDGSTANKSKESVTKLTTPSFILPKVVQTMNLKTCTTTALNLLFTNPEVPDESSIVQDQKVLQLSQLVQNLQAKLSLQSQILNNLKRKYAKRESVIKKLRSELSSLRKERRKLKQREYMRKTKQIKSAQKRKEKRAWICKQIEAGNAQVIQQFQLP